MKRQIQEDSMSFLCSIARHLWEAQRRAAAAALDQKEQAGVLSFYCEKTWATFQKKYFNKKELQV